MINPEPLWDWAGKRHAAYIRQAIRRNEEVFSDNVGAGQRFSLIDPIIESYRFCNVFRELDRVTRWVDKLIRQPFCQHPNLWFMLAIARTINWPDTLQDLMGHQRTWPFGDSFDPSAMMVAMQRRKDAGHKLYTGAYMVRAESGRTAPWFNESKQYYVAHIVLGRLWEDRFEWQRFLDSKPTVQDVHKRFMEYHGWGSFMAYQVCVDMMHTRYLFNAPDKNSWAALGLGSARGLNRLAGRPVKFKLSQEQGLAEMLSIYETQALYRPLHVPHVPLSDIQNCLCETDKYLRVKNGEGRPRSYYHPTE